MARTLAWVGVALGAVYLIYIGGGWWGIYSPYLRITTMLIAAVALAAWAFAARRNPAWRPQTVMWPAIVACLGSLAISTAFSRVPRVSLEYLGYAIVLVALYLLLVRLFANSFFRRRLVVLATMLFVVSAVAYLGQVLGGWVDWWGLVGSIGVPPLRPGFGGLTYNNPSAALTMVCLLAIPTVATFGGTSRRGLAVLVVVIGTIGLVGLVSGSRAGWFALGLTAAVGATVWLGVREHRAVLMRAGRLVIGSAQGRILGLIAVAALAGLAIAFAPAVVRRAFEGGENLRIGYAVTAIRMFQESPIVGTGPGTWVIQRGSHTYAPEPDYFIPHAHNVEVQALAELGLVGAAAAAVLVGSVFWLLLEAARGADRGRKWWAWATGIGLLYLVLHQLLDFYMNMPAFLFAAALPIAYLDATAPVVPQWSAAVVRASGGQHWSRRLITAVVCAALIGLLAQEIPASRQADAVALATDHDWQAADAPARQAAAMDPDVSSYEFTAGLTSARAGDHDAAADYFRRVASRDDLPEAWLNLAAEQVEIGDNSEAASSLTRSLRLGYQRVAVTFAAGDVALRTGNEALAIELFSMAVARSPTLAGDPWWQSEPRRMEIYPAVIEAALAVRGGDWQVALMAGDPKRARSLAGSDVLAAVVIDAWQHEPDVEALLAGCQTYALDTNWLTWCARVEVRYGRFDDADVFRQRVSLINLASALEAGLVRVSPTGMIGRQLVGDPADLWATYTYRRPAPWDILVPTLVHLALE